MTNTFAKFAIRNFGPSAIEVLEVSDLLRDTSAKLPTLSDDDIAHFDAWAEENVANGPMSRAREHGKKIVAEWAAALGEPSAEDRAAKARGAFSAILDNPEEAVANLTGGLSGASAGGLLGDLGGDDSLESRLQAAMKKRDDLAKKHGEDSTEYAAACLEVKNLTNVSKSRRVLAQALALRGEGVDVPESFESPLDNLPTGGTTLDDLQ